MNFILSVRAMYEIWTFRFYILEFIFFRKLDLQNLKESTLGLAILMRLFMSRLSKITYNFKDTK